MTTAALASSTDPQSPRGPKRKDAMNRDGFVSQYPDKHWNISI
jgi:hypothetical protein